MECVRDIVNKIPKLLVILFFSIVLFVNPASSFDSLKCNLVNESIFTFNCPNAKRIWINFMDYHTVDNGICSRRGGCNKTLHGDADGILCHGQYGQCTQHLDNTILDDTCSNVTSLSAEINYECIDVADGPRDKVNCPLPNESELRTYLACPDNSTIHVHSVGYWKISKNQTCLESKEQCYKYKTGVEDLLYKKCRGENVCRPTLPNSIDDGLSCNYHTPNIGAEINYTCLNTENMYDVCDSFEVEVPNNTAVYLTSKEYINKPGAYEEPFCKCQVTSRGMDVKLLYYDMPPDKLEKTSLLTLYDASEALKLFLPETVDAEPFINPKENLSVEFVHNNISNQFFLIEFKALNGSLVIKCGNPTPITVPDSTTDSTHGLATQTPIVVTVGSSTKNTNEGGLVKNSGTNSKLGDNDILIIGIVLGLLVLIALIILVIALIIRRRRQYKADEEESVCSGVDNPAYLHQTYTVLESDTKSQSSDFISDPQNQTSIPINQEQSENLSETREIDRPEHIENNGLNRIDSTNNYMGSIPESIPEANESLDDFDPNYHDTDHFRECVPTTSAPSVLATPPVEHVEYAKVNKLKRAEVQYSSLFDNSFSNITPPQIPDKTYTAEEISDYRKEKLVPYINIDNTPDIDEQCVNDEDVLNVGEDVIQQIPIQPDVVILESNSGNSKRDDEESVMSGNDLSTVPEEDENLDMTSSFPDVSSTIESPQRKLPHQSSYTEVPFLY